MWTRRLKVRKVIESIQKSLRESSATLSQLRPFKLISRKLWSDYYDIYENSTDEADTLETHSDSLDLETAFTSPDKQSPSPAIANQEAFATRSRKKRKKKHQRKDLLTPTSRPIKLNKATTQKILLRRKKIPDRLRILLDPARRPQCHPFPARERMKPGLHKCTLQQPVSGVNRRLYRSRHFSPRGSNRQSRVSSSRLSSNKAGEAALVNLHALSFKGNHYDSFPTAEDTYIAKSHQDIAVKVWLSLPQPLHLVL